jgi:SAM-dependent methyltransferase
VGLNASSSERGTPLAAGMPDEVVWHDLECGSYRADLELWRELADEAASPPGSEPILEVGAGTGRVALDLARRGHRLTAVDLRPALLSALSERASGLDIETACADARTVELDRRDFALCLVPMQTLQLLGGSAARGTFLRHARAHLRPRGLLAAAIITDVEPFDCAGSDDGPLAETARVGSRVYESRAVGVRAGIRTFRIERDRRILDVDMPADRPPPVPVAVERDAIELDRVRVSRLRREAQGAGLQLLDTREIPATADHVGSTVVILRA